MGLRLSEYKRNLYDFVDCCPRLLLEEACRRVAYAVLKSFRLGREGNELVGVLGEPGERNNLEVVLRLISCRVRARLGVNSDRRCRAALGYYARLRREMARVDEEVVVLIEENLPGPDEAIETKSSGTRPEEKSLVYGKLG